MSAKLNEYNLKRDFEKTLEPKGIAETPRKKLRFVVQHHMARAEHYDFRLEWDGVLLSWAIPKGPSYDTYDKRLAIKVEDHPLEYRNFEGTIPKGEYGGGVVMLWDEGYWEPYVDVKEGIEKGELKFKLEGTRLKGNWALIKWKSKSDKEKEHWLLIKEKDEYVEDSYNISEFNTSIRTGRTMSEIEDEKDVKKEKPEGVQSDLKVTETEIKITHPNKVLYELPEITKSDVAKYYTKVSTRMLPFLTNRILSVVRCPKGISELCFFMKHPNTQSKEISLINVDSRDGEKDKRR